MHFWHFNELLQRVKVYRLKDNGKWDDQGTGHVTIDYIEVCFDYSSMILLIQTSCSHDRSSFTKMKAALILVIYGVSADTHIILIFYNHVVMYMPLFTWLLDFISFSIVLFRV
jgi:hypothetical protein